MNLDQAVNIEVALMGLEDTGFALANQAFLWIDPLDYRPISRAA